MKATDFATLEIGDYVKVKAWGEIEGIAPVEMRRYCEERFRVHAINRENSNVLATKMTDYDGLPLYVGDVVNIKKILPKEVREIKKFLEKMIGDKGRLEVLNGVNEQAEKVYTAAVIEADGEAFVCEIREDYNDKKQDTDEWIVEKIVDHSAVRDGAVIDGIKYCRS